MYMKIDKILTASSTTSCYFHLQEKGLKIYILNFTPSYQE